MTLQAFPEQLVPGGATSPSLLWHLQFLDAEADTTERLAQFYREAHMELDRFVRTGSLTASDATFYRQLLSEVDRVGADVTKSAQGWATTTIPAAYEAGWRAFSSTVIPTRSLEALSKSTLGLISQTTDGIRSAIRQQIAQGILQGLSGADVRQRILATGLSNIPHWPSVEYRAGVIARTETMTAFNGGVLSGIESTGATFVRWIISPDEAVCPICGPRARVVFRLKAWEGPGNDPYPNAMPLPKLPAHPRCRCTIRGEYRSAEGSVLEPGRAVVTPKLPTGVMGGKNPPIVPLSRADFAQSVARLPGYGSANAETWNLTSRLLRLTKSGMTDDELDGFLAIMRGSNPRVSGTMSAFRALEARLDVNFWRGLGQLTDDEIRALAAMKGAAGNDGWMSFLQLRYGITFGKVTGWTPELRAATLSALERIRAINPGYVVDSDYLRYLGMAPPGARRFGSNTIARAFPQGYVQGNMTSWQTFTTRPLRSGQATGAEEVILHEILHTIHYRFGYYDARVNPASRSSVFRAVEAIDDAWHDEYLTIRRETTNIVAPASLADLRTKAAQYRQTAASLGYNPADTSPYASGSSYIRTAEQLEETIRKIEAGGIELYPTEYARTEYAEDFAEAGMMFFLNPGRLRTYSPKRYAFFRDRVFGGFTP